MGEVRPQVLLPRVVESTYDAIATEIKKEFSCSTTYSNYESMEYTVGRIYTGKNLKLKTEVNPEVTSAVVLPVIVDPLYDIPHLNEIKKELSLSAPNLHAVTVKHEDTSRQYLDCQIRLGAPVLKLSIKSDNDDIYIKLDPLLTEEVHIKNEIDQYSIHQTTRKITRVKHVCCSLCDSKFVSKKNLQLHLNIHTGAKLFHCNVCGYKCTLKFGLERHMAIHTGEKPFQCGVCGAKFALKCTLRRHILTHTGEKPFQCSICDAKFRQQSTLNRHMKTHTREKPFQCTECDYKCKRKHDLLKHISIPAGEKSFQCSICGAKCTQKCTLHRHMKTHAGEKPFRCTGCDYKSKRKNDLQRHMAIHTREKSLECSVCNAKFGRKSNLQRHLKTHLGE